VPLQVMLSSFWVVSAKPGTALVGRQGRWLWQGRGWFLAPRDRWPEAGEYCMKGTLHYLACSTTSARRQFLVFESGRVSMMRTTSPTFAWFCSSCAWIFCERRTTFL
jgi:hypothetical protein